tara:strand:- start:110 stop:211 length:102 start_codon:yes stop_codon:yes gene_type:complete
MDVKFSETSLRDFAAEEKDFYELEIKKFKVTRS